jgi:hypothetical protein
MSIVKRLREAGATVRLIDGKAFLGNTGAIPEGLLSVAKREKATIVSLLAIERERVSEMLAIGKRIGATEFTNALLVWGRRRHA